jgi:acetyl-CoA acyltransferase 1
MKVRSVTPADGDKTEVIDEKIISADEGIRPQTALRPSRSSSPRSRATELERPATAAKSVMEPVR